MTTCELRLAALVAYDPPKVFSITWGGELLRFELVPDGAGTLLVFTQMLSHPSVAARNGSGWHMCLVALDLLLDVEGVDEVVELLTDQRLDLAVDDPARPILLAVSDNGPPMAAADTRAFMALMAIAQHRGRPHTPTDQAWIESFFGHIKGEWPHLDDITDPAVLDADLARVRIEYNSVRLHEAIGYVTPNDEHEGRGNHIREARRQGLARARQQRLEHHRRHNHPHPEETP